MRRVRRVKFTRVELLLVLILLPALFYYSVDSYMFLQPVALSVEGTTGTFVRRTPFGNVYGSSKQSMVHLRSGLHCEPRLRHTLYQQVDETDDLPADTVQYTLDRELLDCWNRGGPVIYTIQWRIRDPWLDIEWRPIEVSYTLGP